MSEDVNVNMVVSSYGAGTNSTALLVEIATNQSKEDMRPECILFADTGGERPETYEYLSHFSAWLVRQGLPAIQIVRKVTRTGDVLSLEQDCRDKRMLPSIAYGFKSCSQKYKVQPQDKYFNNFPKARNVWANGGKLVKLIGYDAGEQRRAKIYADDKYHFRYPLIEWNWGREECVAAIKHAGLPLPGKSACFFCPSSRKPEILELRDRHPDLLARALALETNANLTSIKGLGRRFSWAGFLDATPQQRESFCEVGEQPCGCYDGGPPEPEDGSNIT